MKSSNQLKRALCGFSFVLCVMTLPTYGQPTSPGAGSTGTPVAPPAGAYPGSGSSPQPGVPPPSTIPSGPTPGSASTGTTNNPPSGATPGTGTSIPPNH
jgi:hypothetical protein